MENRMNGNTVRVWTKQHENVLRELETKGRYVARREYILADLGEHAPLVLEAYDWLVKHTPAAGGPARRRRLSRMGVLKIRGHHAEEPGNRDPGADPVPGPDRAGKHHEMGSGPGLFVYSS